MAIKGKHPNKSPEPDNFPTLLRGLRPQGLDQTCVVLNMEIRILIVQKISATSLCIT